MQKIFSSLKASFIILLAIYLLAVTGLVYILTRADRIAHAVISMGSGLVLLWIVLCGSIMYVFRDAIRSILQRIPIHWQTKFIVFGILMALLEEVITTSMTNLAPLFGVRLGEAYITASANYLDVVLFHSVVVFVPWFIAWAWILKRYTFSPFWVFLLFGLNGLLAESLTFGWQHLNEFALWIFVYGLMIYLPAYTVPADRGALPPKVWHGVLAFILPFLFGIPWALLVGLLLRGHPSIHFLPLPTR